MFHSVSRHSRPRIRSGFTLIELVVVVAILAAIAGLVLPRFDFMRRSADAAASASASQEVFNNLQVYRTVKGVYPDQFDSLLDNTGATYSKLFGHPSSSFIAGELPAIGADQSQLSFLHLIGSSVYDHGTASYPSDSGSILRTTTGAAAFKVAVINPSSSAIVQTIYPDVTGVPAGVTLVALGVGPKCTAVGTTMAAPPIYGGLDPQAYYSRFICVFAVYASGKRAELRAVVDPAGSTVNTALKNFYTNTPD